MGSLLMLGGIALVGVVGYFALSWYRDKPQRELRANPPTYEAAQVTTTRGVKDSQDRMRKLFGQLVRLTDATPEERRQGKGGVTFEFVVDHPAGSGQDRARFNVVTDPERAEAVQRAVATDYARVSNVLPHEQHPLEELGRKYSAREDAAAE